MPTLFTKPIELLAATDAEGVVGWPESSTVEFKERLPARDGRDDAWLGGGDVERYAQDKLFKEVVAFANTSGGHLVLGVAETKAKPPAAASVSPVLRCVDLAERLGRAAQSLIDPPIPLLLVRGVPTQGDAGIVVFRVPASRAAPHRGPDKECYVRRDTESVPVGMREIQNMTLAAGRRDEVLDARFAGATRGFVEWFSSPMKDQAELVGFRITAVPVSACFDLGRLYGQDDALVVLQQVYQIAVEGGVSPGQHHAEALLLPNRARPRPIVRGVRRFRGNESSSVAYLDTYSDGTVNFGFRVPLETRGKPSIYLGWVVAHAANVLRTANGLRATAGAPDCEYGVEVEVRCTPGGEPQALGEWLAGHGFNDAIGESLRNMPLLLPRLSFGPLEELDAVISLIANDLCDAAAVRHPQPLSLSLKILERV